MAANYEYKPKKQVSSFNKSSNNTAVLTRSLPKKADDKLKKIPVKYTETESGELIPKYKYARYAQENREK